MTPNSATDNLTVHETAKELRLSESTIYRGLRDGRIRGSKPFGSKWVIPRTEIAAAMKRGLWLVSESDPMPHGSAGRGGHFGALLAALESETHDERS